MRCEVKNCSGCKACENICPTGCLKIDTSGKYLFVKDIDVENCIKCGKCADVCPMQMVRLEHPVSAYVARSKNTNILRNSASGGIGATIYYHCLEHGISCVGVLFDKNYNLKYEFIKSQEDIKKASGSKYVYSDMNTVYQKIEDKLKKSKKVVFIGLSCHVSGLVNYCMEKKIPTELLYTVDILCHGVPMPVFFKQHLFRKCKNVFEKKIAIYFRKHTNPYGLTLEDEGKVIYKKSRDEDAYMMMYRDGYYTTGCHQCPYATGDRCSDMTIMDCCAGKEVLITRMSYGKSEVLINSTKGMELFDWINSEDLYIQKTKVEMVISEDTMLQYATPMPRYCELFYKLERGIGFEYAVKVVHSLKFIRKH